MIVGRESLVQLEELERKQKRLYGDACDMGLDYSETLRKKLHSICKDLRKDFIGTTQKWLTGCSWSCFIPVELADSGEEYDGYHVSVSLITDHKGNKKFFIIDTYHKTQKESGFRKG